MQEENIRKNKKKLLCKILIVFLVLIFFIQNILYLGVTVFTNKKEYKQEELIEITIANDSWHKVFINETFGPYFDIEKFDGGKWIQIPRKTCVGWCAPSGSLVLSPKETKKNIWQKSSDGRYRVKIKASIFPREYDMFMKLGKNIYSKEFVIR